MESNLLTSKHLLFVLIIYSVQTSLIQSQETKGGSISVNFHQLSNQAKGGGTGRSSFRENIESFRRLQQQVVQPVQPVHQTNIVKESVSSYSSSSSVPQGPVTLGQQQEQQIVVEQQEQQSGLAQSEPASYGGVAGTPGVDFPNYISIPNTRFSCDGLPFNPGMYADESTGCQVYHLCYRGRMESFLCGIGTVFNQAIMNCDFWHSVDCSKSSQYYQLNADFGKSLGEPVAPQQTRPQTSKTSSQVVSQRSTIVLPARTPLVSSSAKSQQSSRAVQIINRPAAVNTIQSDSEFSASRFTSDTRQNSQYRPGILHGKTSTWREEQTSGGFLSPARRLQLNQGQLDGGSGQFTSESSTRFKVMPGIGMGNLNAGQSSLSVGSSLVVADNGAIRPAEQETLEKHSLGGVKVQQQAEHTSTITKTSNHDNGGWRPYYKSKSSSKSATAEWPPATTATSFMRTPAPTTNASSVTESPQPAEPATVSQPDQEPLFSRDRDQILSQEVPKQPGITSTTESSPGISSFEPDAGSVTQRPPDTAAKTTRPAPAATSDGQVEQSETPGRSEPPPPTEGPAGSSEAPPSTTTATATRTTQTTSIEETSTSGGPESGQTQRSSGLKEGSIGTTTTASPPTTTTLNGGSRSMVEYADGNSGEGESETEKASEAEGKKRAAARRRKAT